MVSRTIRLCCSSVRPVMLAAILYTCSIVQGFDSAKFESLFNNYHNSISPGDAADEMPTTVYVNMYIISFDSMDATSMDVEFEDQQSPHKRDAVSEQRPPRAPAVSFSTDPTDYKMSIYFRQSWVDKRLRYNASDFNNKTRLTIPYNKIDKLWTPDLAFGNEKEGHFHEITKPNQGILLYPNGTILFSVRLSVTLQCNMDLSKFPLDNQTCGVAIGSYAYTEDELTLRWMRKRMPNSATNAVEINPKLNHPAFYFHHMHLSSDTDRYLFGLVCIYFHRLQRLLTAVHSEIFSIWSDIYTDDSITLRWRRPNPIELKEGLSMPQFEHHHITHSEGTETLVTGDFSKLEAKFHLTRQIGYYILQTYIPSILVVMLSWVSFFVAVEATPARVSLGILTVLTMTTLFSGARASLPKVSYVKALDVWISACLAFVFSALIEYACVNIMYRRFLAHEKKRVARQKQDIAAALSSGAAPARVRDDSNGAYERCGDDENHIFVRRKPAAKHGGTSMITAPLMSQKRQRDALQLARFVDKASGLAFPAAFLLFNIIYWSVYSAG